MLRRGTSKTLNHPLKLNKEPGAALEKSCGPFTFAEKKTTMNEQGKQRMADDRYDFYEDDWYDGAAIMTIRGRRERLETLFNHDSYQDATKEENK